MSQMVDLLGKPVLSIAHTALRLRVSHIQASVHAHAHTFRDCRQHIDTQRGEEERHQQKEQESNTNLVAIRDRSAARSS